VKFLDKGRGKEERRGSGEEIGGDGAGGRGEMGADDKEEEAVGREVESCKVGGVVRESGRRRWAAMGDFPRDFGRAARQGGSIDCARVEHRAARERACALPAHS